MSEDPDAGPEIQSVMEDLKTLQSLHPRALPILGRLIKYLKEEPERARSLEAMNQYLDFCLEHPAMALIIALTGGVFGEGVSFADLDGPETPGGGSPAAN